MYSKLITNDPTVYMISNGTYTWHIRELCMVSKGSMVSKGTTWYLREICMVSKGTVISKGAMHGI